jgi:hypothetical protein
MHQVDEGMARERIDGQSKRVSEAGVGTHEVQLEV